MEECEENFTPMTQIPDEAEWDDSMIHPDASATERAALSDPEIRASLRRGMETARGDLVSRGSFAKYADD